MNICPVLSHPPFNHSKSGLPLQHSAHIKRTEIGVLKRKKKNQTALVFSLHLLTLSHWLHWTSCTSFWPYPSASVATTFSWALSSFSFLSCLIFFSYYLFSCYFPLYPSLVSILYCCLQILFFGSEIAVPLQLNLLFSVCWQQSEMWWKPDLWRVLCWHSTNQIFSNFYFASSTLIGYSRAEQQGTETEDSESWQRLSLGVGVQLASLIRRQTLTTHRQWSSRSFTDWRAVNMYICGCSSKCWNPGQSSGPGCLFKTFAF